MMRHLFSLVLFSFYFSGGAQITLVKGPYANLGTSNSVVLRWETDILCNSKIHYGTNPHSFSDSIIELFPVTSHSFQINGLLPYTKYYYRIGTTTSIIQGDTNNYFITSPVAGTGGKYRFWVTGDCGNLSQNQLDCKNAYLNYTKNVPTNGWLLIGDNAYSSGTNAEYNSNFFAVYQADIMKKTVLWPAPGNHDYTNGSVTTPTVPYYDIFSMPANGEAGGLASGTKAYYSYNYGNIHFISLDSYGTDVGNKKMYDTTSAQALWLKQDLAANKQLWTIVYWHHPPFSMGSHNSDTELDLVQIRTDFVRMLERYNVDLVMSGHSHDYERSKLMKGHYGPEATFTASVHHLDSSSALYNGSANSCPYKKDSLLNKSGTVYVVAGSAGQVGGKQPSFPHDAMFYSNADKGGSLVLDFDNNRLDVKWLCGDGIVRDKFTIMKEVNKVKNMTVYSGQSQTLAASWPGTYTWNNLAQSSAITINPTSDINYWVHDAERCLSDTIKIRVLPKSDFIASITECAGRHQTFQDASTNMPVSWSWSVEPNYGIIIESPSSQNPEIYFGNAGNFTVTLVASNVYGQGLAVSKIISVGLCSGGGSEYGKVVRPNPSNGKFSVEIFQYYETELFVYDVLGKVAHKQIINNGITEIETNCDPGVYYFSVVTRGEIVAKGKLMILK